MLTSCCNQAAGVRTNVCLLLQVEVAQKEKALDTIQAKVLELKQLCNTKDMPTSLQVWFVIQVHELLGQHPYMFACIPLISNSPLGYGG